MDSVLSNVFLTCYCQSILKGDVKRYVVSKPHLFTSPFCLPLEGKGDRKAVDEVVCQRVFVYRPTPHPSAFGCHLPLKGKAFFTAPFNIDMMMLIIFSPRLF